MPKARHLTIDDLWKLQRPAAPTLSPDYSHACVTVTKYNMDENKGTTRLWLLAMDGSGGRELTQCGEKDGQPQWSPDGRTIAFVAKRQGDDEPQIYTISPDGGEAKRLTSIATGVSAIKWFPDSKRIACVSWVWPNEKGEKAQAKRYKEKKDDKVKAHVVEHDTYRFWDHWITDGRVPHLLMVDIANGKSTDLFEGSKWDLPWFDTDAHHYDISLDGKTIAFTFNPDPRKHGDALMQIVEMDVKSRKAKVITPDNGWSYESPRYSPGGKRIAAVAMHRKKHFLEEPRLAIHTRGKADWEIVTRNWDRGVDAPLKWNADGTGVLFCAESEARRHVWCWSENEKTPRMMVKGGTVAEFDARGGALVVIKSTLSQPPKVFACTELGEDLHAIEDFNDRFMRQFTLGDVREFTVKGAKGENVQMWAIYPPNFNPKKKYPLMNIIHGGPHAIFGDNFFYRWNKHVFAAQGYVCIAVNYHGSSSFGQSFVQSTDGGRWGEYEMIDVDAGSDFMIKQGYIDKHRLCATGGSYGGYMVAYMNGRTDRYKAFICHAGCYDWISMFADDAWYGHPKELGGWYWEKRDVIDRQNPAYSIKNAKTPTLVIHGELDYRVPAEQGLMYYNTLRAKGVPSRLVYFPDENHWILKPQNSRLWFKEYFAWLKRYV